MKKYFSCPECGRKDISVQDMDKSVATVKCGSCGIERKVPKMSIADPVDVFGDFIDIVHSEKKPSKPKTQTFDDLVKNSGFLEF